MNTKDVHIQYRVGRLSYQMDLSYICTMNRLDICLGDQPGEKENSHNTNMELKHVSIFQASDFQASAPAARGTWRPTS